MEAEYKKALEIVETYEKELARIKLYDTFKRGAGKVQLYLRFISSSLFIRGDNNLQFFSGFGRELFANL